MRTIWTVLACASVVACAGARPPPAPPQERPHVTLSADALLFASFDTNGDLRIDAAELSAGIAREWARADANGDGAISPLEYQTWADAALGGAQSPPFRLDFDRDVNNSITRAEFETELNARAQTYDVNHDGVLVFSEFVRPAPSMQRDAMGPGGGGQHRGAREGGGRRPR